MTHFQFCSKAKKKKLRNTKTKNKERTCVRERKRKRRKNEKRIAEKKKEKGKKKEERAERETERPWKLRERREGRWGRKRLGLEREGREENVWVWQLLFLFFIKTQHIKHQFSFLQSSVHATWQSLGSHLGKTQLLYIYIYMIRAMDNRLAARLGTWRTEAKVIEGVTETNPLPNTCDREPSAILTLSPPEQGLYDENKWDIPIIWSEAPKSMTHRSSEGVADAFKAVAQLPVKSGGGSSKCVQSRHKSMECFYLVFT
jgi:hypothetical protein